MSILIVGAFPIALVMKSRWCRSVLFPENELRRSGPRIELVELKSGIADGSISVDPDDAALLGRGVQTEVHRHATPRYDSRSFLGERPWPSLGIGGPVARAREAVARQAWQEAYDLLTEADGSRQLDTDGVAMRAEIAYLVGEPESRATRGSACTRRGWRKATGRAPPPPPRDRAHPLRRRPRGPAPGLGDERPGPVGGPPRLAGTRGPVRRDGMGGPDLLRRRGSGAPGSSTGGRDREPRRRPTRARSRPTRRDAP